MRFSLAITVSIVATFSILLGLPELMDFLRMPTWLRLLLIPFWLMVIVCTAMGPIWAAERAEENKYSG
jgi:hypothetical protein